MAVESDSRLQQENLDEATPTEVPKSAADLRDISYLLPIGLTVDPKNLLTGDELQGEADNLAQMVTSSMGRFMGVSPSEVVNNVVVLEGHKTQTGQPEIYETIIIAAAPLFLPETDTPNGTQYTVERKTAINGSLATELATVSAYANGERNIRLDRFSAFHGNTNAADGFIPNSQATANGALQIIGDVNLAAQRGDSSLSVQRIAQIRPTDTPRGIHKDRKTKVYEPGAMIEAIKSRYDHERRGSRIFTAGEGEDQRTYEILASRKKGEDLSMRYQVQRTHRGVTTYMLTDTDTVDVTYRRSIAPTQEAKMARVSFPNSGLVFAPQSGSRDAQIGASLLVAQLLKDVAPAKKTGSSEPVAAFSTISPYNQALYDSGRRPNGVAQRRSIGEMLKAAGAH